MTTEKLKMILIFIAVMTWFIGNDIVKYHTARLSRVISMTESGTLHTPSVEYLEALKDYNRSLVNSTNQGEDNMSKGTLMK